MLLWSISAFGSLYEFNDIVQRSGQWFLLANMQSFSDFFLLSDCFYPSSQSQKNLPLRVQIFKWTFYDIKEILSVDFTGKEEQNLLVVNKTQDWHYHLSARADRICFYQYLNAATYNSQFALSSAHVWGCFCVINVFQLLSNKKLLPCSRDINPYLSPL